MSYLDVVLYLTAYLFVGMVLAALVSLVLDTPAGERFMEWLGL